MSNTHTATLPSRWDDERGIWVGPERVSATTPAPSKHLVHLKNHGGTHFAVAEISANKRPNSDLELFKAVAASGGAYVCAFRGYSYDLTNPEWICAEEFERTWRGD
jgi:hypothetical protein